MSFDLLLELAWKSALIAGAALALATLLKHRSAGERSALLATAAALIVALPLITALLPALPVVTSTVHATAPVAIPPEMLAAAAAAMPEPAAAPSVFDDPSLLVLWLWGGGAAMVAMRLLAGLWTLRRWTRAGEPIASPAWQEALRRTAAEAGVHRPIRLLRADVAAPLSWGAIRPVILIDPDTAREPGEAEAVLAHEIAHIARGDWPILILSRLAVALFWFNPLMWLLESRIVREAEEAADARALLHVEPARYAQTLLSCAQHYSALRLPATGMADAALGARVRAILERRLPAGAPHPRWVRLAVIAVAAVGAPIAALKPVQAIVRTDPPVAPSAPQIGAAPADMPEAPTAPSAPQPPSVLPAPGAATRAPMVPSAPSVPLAPRAALAPLRAAFAAAYAPAAPLPPVPPVPPRYGRSHNLVDGDEIAREVQAAVSEARVASEEALRSSADARREALAHIDARAIAAQAAHAAADAQRQVRVSMAAGAEGMRRGADGMERGARQMDEEAERLRSPDYRARQIAKAAREGRHVTDEELQRAIPKMHGGAEGMRRGAAEMRRSAEKMRREG